MIVKREEIDRRWAEGSRVNLAIRCDLGDDVMTTDTLDIFVLNVGHKS